MPEKIDNKYKKGPRASVSAEAFGEYNKKGDFKAQIVNKSEQTRDKIAARLNQAFMFQALDDNEKAVVITAMDERRAKAGEAII